MTKEIKPTIDPAIEVRTDQPRTIIAPNSLAELERRRKEREVRRRLEQEEEAPPACPKCGHVRGNRTILDELNEIRDGIAQIRAMAPLAVRSRLRAMDDACKRAIAMSEPAPTDADAPPS